MTRERLNSLRRIWPALLFAVSAGAAQSAPVPENISFVSSDGVRVYGYLYRADAGNDAPVVLLFHQAGGDARGEYGPLVGRLVAAGYHAIAIDQRLGGDRFAGVNRTMAELAEGDYGYCDVYPDIEAALKFVVAGPLQGKIAVWGSSYSAALVFQLAAREAHDVAAVLAFSPASGEPMAACRPENFSGDLKMPVLALRPEREMEVPSVPPQMAVFREHGHQTYVASPGVHGSSMLNESRVGASTDAAWVVVLEFLESSLKP